MITTMIPVETLIPEDVYLTLRSRGIHREALAKQFNRAFALFSFRTHQLSLGQAATLAGMDRWRFIEFLGENNVPVIDWGEEELEAEFQAVELLSAELT